MSQPPAAYQQPPRRSNGLGIAGFIVSLVGLFTLGVLCPLGLLLSFFALFRRPRGFAIAGFIIGLIGTLFLAAWVALFGFAGFSCLSFGKPFFATGMVLESASGKIETYKSGHAGVLPDDAAGNLLIAGENDGWGHQFRYQQRGFGSYEVRSAGPDGIFDNTDDIQKNFPSR